MYLGRPLVVGDLESFDEQAVQVEASCGHLEVNIELAYSATTHAQVADVNLTLDAPKLHTFSKLSISSLIPAREVNSIISNKNIDNLESD